METFAPRFPRPQAFDLQPSTYAYERGRANDEKVHATHATLAGTRPLCNDELRVGWVEGRFSPYDAAACEDCARLVLR